MNLLTGTTIWNNYYIFILKYLAVQFAFIGVTFAFTLAYYVGINIFKENNNILVIFKWTKLRVDNNNK